MSFAEEAVRDVRVALLAIVDAKVSEAVAPLREQVAALTEEVARLRLATNET